MRVNTALAVLQESSSLILLLTLQSCWSLFFILLCLQIRARRFVEVNYCPIKMCGELYVGVYMYVYVCDVRIDYCQKFPFFQDVTWTTSWSIINSSFISYYMSVIHSLGSHVDSLCHVVHIGDLGHRSSNCVLKKWLR